MSTIFDLKIQVEAKHIDVLGHVNNVMYVQWMQDVAAAHIEALGLGLKQYFELKKMNQQIESQTDTLNSQLFLLAAELRSIKKTLDAIVKKEK